MGLFDFFGREPKVKNDRIESRVDNDFNLVSDTQKAPVTVFCPKSYAEVERIIDCLRSNKTAIVHLSSLKNETAIRVLDMLSGAVYALNGGVYEMEKNIFMFSPSGVEML